MVPKTKFRWARLSQLIEWKSPVTLSFKSSIHPLQLFHDGGLYHKETSQLIFRANQRTGSYMIGTSVMNELKALRQPCRERLEMNFTVLHDVIRFHSWLFTISVKLKVVLQRHSEITWSVADSSVACFLYA